MAKTRHFLSLKDASSSDIMKLIKLALAVKKNPKKYSTYLENKTLVMFFDKVSVRTRMSFELGMYQLGGYALFYSIEQSTLGKKESVEDFARVVGRYTDGIMARISSKEDIEKIARFSGVPVINGMTDFEHPCQILCDLMTIYEKKKRLKGLKMAYVGDGYNNTTHALLYGCSKAGMDISVASPKQFMPDKGVVADSIKFAKHSGSRVESINDPKAAVKDADIVYADSWMSYHIPHNLESKRVKIFSPYQVNRNLMNFAKKGAYFMHCLPAKRGQEVTGDVMDSKSSIIFDQAENRLHGQKAILLQLLRNNS